MRKKTAILSEIVVFSCLFFANEAIGQQLKKSGTTQNPILPSITKSNASARTPQQILKDQTINPKNIQLANSVMDVVVPDDQIIQGSQCVGLDCVNNEIFGFDTERYKENNNRIGFDDTSVGTSFPNNDWQIEANESAIGGTNSFSILDITGSKTPFKIIAGAPTSSFFMSSAGKLGLKNSSPVLDIDILTGDTPAIRLQQNASSGFIAQTWDMAGNDANFFVRDVTGGSRLPFRIQPGAPTNSLYIGASNVFVKNAILPGASAPSDERLKKDVLPLNNATKIILHLSPKTYFYDTKKYPDYGFNNNLQYGLIAQEVEKILPTLVNETSFPDKAVFKTLNYGGLIPILVKAVQEQQSEIEQLKAKLARYEELNARMERLETMLNNEEKERKAEKK